MLRGGAEPVPVWVWPVAASPPNSAPWVRGVPEPDPLSLPPIGCPPAPPVRSFGRLPTTCFSIPLSNFSSLLGSAIAKILRIAATLHLDNCGGLLSFRFGISNAVNGATHTKRAAALPSDGPHVRIGRRVAVRLPLP